MGAIDGFWGPSLPELKNYQLDQQTLDNIKNKVGIHKERRKFEKREEITRANMHTGEIFGSLQDLLMEVTQDSIVIAGERHYAETSAEAKTVHAGILNERLRTYGIEHIISKFQTTNL